MRDRITEAEIRGIEEHGDVALPGTGVSGPRVAEELRYLRGLLVRIIPLHAGESLAALAARYGVERAQQWREVLDEAEAIQKEQGA